MLKKHYRMSLSSPTQLTDAQVDAVATAIDACAAIAAYSNKEDSLQILMDGLSFEFGENQTQRIVSRAPKFNDILSGKNESPPEPVPQPYTVMSLVRRRTADRANKSLTKNQIDDAVKAMTY